MKPSGVRNTLWNVALYVKKPYGASGLSITLVVMLIQIKRNINGIADVASPEKNVLAEHFLVRNPTRRTTDEVSK
ncbi:MAG: hypothetical protein H6546_07210 [Chitinophagales bacterium]|nr:hypothetical protein [Chitinophagales bacterium]